MAESNFAALVGGLVKVLHASVTAAPVPASRSSSPSTDDGDNLSSPFAPNDAEPAQTVAHRAKAVSEIWIVEAVAGHSENCATAPDWRFEIGIAHPRVYEATRNAPLLRAHGRMIRKCESHRTSPCSS